MCFLFLVFLVFLHQDGPLKLERICPTAPAKRHLGDELIHAANSPAALVLRLAVAAGFTVRAAIAADH